MILGINGIIAGKGSLPMDADAQAFITAASITDTTQQNAVNKLVWDLKGASLWSKMKAIYPFVGGTASSHKFNLKDPRDLDAAYRLVFSGGGTHSSTGYLGNGTNSYGRTFILQNSLQQNSVHLSYYNRYNSSATYNNFMGCVNTINAPDKSLYIAPTLGINAYYSGVNSNETYTTPFYTSINKYWLVNRSSSTQEKTFINGVLGSTINKSSTTLTSNEIYVGAINVYGNAGINEAAFASIGDGLTDAEAANFYTAVQTFQTTLGRQVGVPIVADSDAQAFLNAAVITDTTQANAINTLVTDLKSANIWSKMKAIYPFVGGTASSHKFNLKDPRDLDAAFRLVFNGGWTHSSTGALPNGTNAYANTYLIPSNVQILDSNGFGFYTPSLNTTASTDVVPMGSYTSAEKSSTMGYINNNTKITSRLNYYIITSSTIVPTGLLSTQKTSGILTTLYKNGTNIGSGNSSGFLSIYPFYFGTANVEGTPYSAGYVNHQFRLVYISDGLDSTDMTAFYTAVQAYQTSLSRQV